MLVNINPALWGKPYWDMMHYVTLAYPENPLENRDEVYFTNNSKGDFQNDWS